MLSLTKLLFEKKDYVTNEGSIVEYGSVEHVEELEGLIESLKSLRKQMTRSERKERDRISRCIETIRYLKRKAHKTGVRKGLIEIIED